MPTDREKRFDSQPLSEVANVMAGCQPNSMNDQMAKAEFFLRQTDAIIKQADAAIKQAAATDRMEEHTKRYTKYMFWSVMVLTASFLAQLILEIIKFWRKN